MVQRYEVRGTELGSDAFYEDWVEVVRYEDYAKLEAELQKYKDQLRDMSELVDELLGTITLMNGQSCRSKEDTQECAHEWSRYIVHPYRKICLVCGVKE